MNRIPALAKALALGSALAAPLALVGASGAAASPSPMHDFRICGTGPWGFVQECTEVGGPGWYGDRFWDGGTWRDRDDWDGEWGDRWRDDHGWDDRDWHGGDRGWHGDRGPGWHDGDRGDHGGDRGWRH